MYENEKLQLWDKSLFSYKHIHQIVIWLSLTDIESKVRWLFKQLLLKGQLQL